MEFDRKIYKAVSKIQVKYDGILQHYKKKINDLEKTVKQ